MTRIESALLRAGMCLVLVLGCSSETQVTEVAAPEPLAEAPAADEPQVDDGADGTGAVEALGPVTVAPQVDAPGEVAPAEVNRDDVPWMPGGALIDVTDISDEDDPRAGMVRTVFEVAAPPDDVLASYRAELEKVGYEVKPFGDEMLLATKQDTLVTTVVWPQTGKTKVEVFVSARPEGL